MEYCALYVTISSSLRKKKSVTVAFINESTKGTKQHTRLKRLQFNFISHTRLKIIRKSFVILSTDPVDSTSFLQCFPEKAYGSNSRSCAVLQTRSLQRPPFFKPAYLNPLIPYLGKKIFCGSDWSAEKPQHCSEHIKRS